MSSGEVLYPEESLVKGMEHCASAVTFLLTEWMYLKVLDRSFSANLVAIDETFTRLDHYNQWHAKKICEQI